MTVLDGNVPSPRPYHPLPPPPPPTLSFCSRYVLTTPKTLPPPGRLGGRNGEGEGDWGGDRIGVPGGRGGGGVLVDLSFLFGLLCYSRRLVNIFSLSFGRNDEGGTERILHESCTSLS